MAKLYPVESVLQDWVHTLPFMQQALLLTGMRGPDGLPKYCSVKPIIKCLRGAVCKPAAKRLIGNEDSFMWIDYEAFNVSANVFFDDTDIYPMHFLMHLIHCAEVVGYKYERHDNSINVSPLTIREYWKNFYYYSCEKFHMYPETEQQMDARLNK